MGRDCIVPAAFAQTSSSSEVTSLLLLGLCVHAKGCLNGLESWELVGNKEHPWGLGTMFDWILG